MSSPCTLRTLLVDDEATARLAIRKRLEAVAPQIAVVGEAGNSRDAMEMVNDLQPDLIFLDIAMPGRSGMDMARRMTGKNAPFIIFLTAYGDRAIDAFETDAIDYLTKPVAAERLSRAIDRVYTELKKKKQLQLSKELQTLVEKYDTEAPVNIAPKRISLDVGDSIIQVNEQEISYIEAAGEYACVHVGTDTHIVRVSLKSFESSLPTDQFVRIHRQTIVNLALIDRMIHKPNGEYVAKLSGGQELSISRRKVSSVRSMLSS